MAGPITVSSNDAARTTEGRMSAADQLYELAKLLPESLVTLHVDLVVKTFGRAAESFRAEIVQELCRMLREQPSAAGS
jgi:hypothetical protein